MDNLNEKVSNEEQSQPSCLGAVRRSFSYEELAEHWKFCGNIFQMVKDRNEESTNSIEREATKFTAECIITIMDDLQTLMDT